MQPLRGESSWFEHVAEIALPIVVTAIANSEFEGFVAGTLFSQGWNVVFRALDFDSLSRFIESDLPANKNLVIIFSPDLPGISANSIATFQRKVRQVIGFVSGGTDDQDFVGLFGVPQEASELLNLVRGFVRAPLIRNANIERAAKRRAHVIAIGSPSGASGCTSLAINVAMELSVLGKETILIDADIRHPSIAPMLSLHKLDAEQYSRTIAPHLSVSEFTRERVLCLGDYLDEVVSRHDFVIIDLGSIEGVADSLTDRRWTSTMIHWSCEQADELWLVSKADVLAIHRLETLVRDFSQITIHARVSLALNMNARGKKGKYREEQFLSTAAALNPKGVFTLPRDVGALTHAEEERATLIETNDRSPIRKCIAKIAVELSS